MHVRTITEQDIKSNNTEDSPQQEELSIEKILEGFDPESDKWDRRLLWECAGVKLGP